MLCHLAFAMFQPSSIFQQLMNAVLAGLQWTSCLVYIDDIIVVGSTFDQHLSNLQKVFECLKSAGLKLQLRNVIFSKASSISRAHHIAEWGFLQIIKVLHWLVPTSAIEVQQFLGVANCYRRFVKDFAAKAKPLHRLSEKRLSFKWTAECQKSFYDLKQFFTSAPTLAMPNWSKPFILLIPILATLE